ncbi:MAG: tyrosine-type recombinase/integrase [Syntrophaceae bacterium]|nr:tyrosine-type recombinase/integrase [Syntrophaceae bacterium]
MDTLPLNATALGVLQERYSRREKDSDYVFPSRKGTRYMKWNIFRAFEDASTRAKIPKIRFHDLRHPFETRLVHSGVDLY